MGTDRLARPVELAGERPVQDVGHERALAAARDTGHGDERPERHAQVDVAQVVLARAADLEVLPVAGSPRIAGSGTDRSPRRNAPVIERGSASTTSSGPLAMISPPCSPAPGPDVDDPVGRPDRLLVVLDDEDRVAEVAQPGQRGDELRVVPLVEPDRRLVEDVQDAHQRRADLGGQPDPLRLAAGQGDARAIEGQVVQPDVDEEAEPGDDLLEQLPGDRPLALVQAAIELVGPAQGIRDRQGETSRDVPVADRHAQDLGRSRLPPQTGQGRVTMYFSSSVLMYSESVSR